MNTLIFDGNNAAWRLQKRLPELTAKGRPIQVVYGFLRLIRSALEKFEPTGALVVWDSGRPRIRQEIFPGYKHDRAERRAHPTEEQAQEYKSVSTQLQVIRKLLPKLGVAQVSFQDTEGDDLIAIAACHTLKGRKTIISSDRDMLQLVDEDIDVWSPIKAELYTRKNFFKKLDMSPAQYLEFRSIVGDKTDTLPGGAKGLGEETAKELISKYGSIKTLFLPKIQKKVEAKGNRYALLYGEGVKERIELNLRLMDLRRVRSNRVIERINTVTSEAKTSFNKATVQKFCIEQAFTSLLRDFGRWILPFESLKGAKDE